MRHVKAVSRKPAPAFYYQLTLMEKIEELATLGSLVDSVARLVKELLPSEDV